MVKIVVTGANGFVGGFCLPLLIEQGFEIHALSRRRQGRDANGVEWHQVDLLGENGLTTLLGEIRPSHMLHLAWCTEHGKFWTSSENDAWLDASRRLVESFRSTGGRRFVTAGTCAEYSWRAEEGFDGTCREGVTPERPATLYGKRKKAFADFLSGLTSTGALSTANGRIFLLYGPGEPLTRLVPATIKQLLSGTAPKCTNGLQVRDFLYVDDVARALVALVASNVVNNVNIASGEPRPVRFFVDRIKEAVGMIDATVEFGAIPRLPDDPDVLAASTERLSRELGFRPRTSLSQGMSATVEWVKSTLNSGFAARD